MDEAEEAPPAEPEKKRKGLIRSATGGLFRAGKSTVKATAKVTGKATKVVAKGAYGAGKITAKGGYYTMKNGGKGLLFAARKAYPRHPDESIWQYRKRMAILGFKVSWFTGGIIAAASGSSTVQQFAFNYAKGAVAEEVVKRGFGEVKDAVSSNEEPVQEQGSDDRT